MKVYKSECKNCLLSKNSIVGPERRNEIIKEIRETQSYFVCHKASIEGKDVCCKTFYDKMGHISQMVRIAERLGIVEFIPQPDSEKLISHKEIEQLKSKKS